MSSDDSAQPRVLIVEDEAVLRLTFAEFLKDENFDVTTAGNYEEASRALDGPQFDVVVTDIILEGKTGIDVLRLTHERFPGTAVIVITGEPNVETAAKSVRLGAFDYLAKPVTGRELKRVVRLALDRKRVTDERDEYAAQLDVYRRELEAIFNSVNEAIVTVDGTLNIRQSNAAADALLGANTGELAGKPADHVLVADLAPALDALRKTLLTQQPVIEFNVEANLPHAGTKVLLVSAVPLLDPGNTHAGAVLVARDVTRVSRLEKELEDRQQYRNIVGKSQRMREVFQLVENVAATDSTVLIYGESGTGKELVAAALHYGNPRAKGPFIKVNCAALSDDILESELFGHVKGAFTGAVRDRVGRFEAADGGTILLDEIGDISFRLQQRLLRVLQEREFERVGDTRPIKVDVRIIAATNRDLAAKMRAGEFREDLYYRLNVIRIELPPLREHKEDIPLLVDHFCRRYNAELKKNNLGLAPETMDIVMNYRWPGNVRELENCLERAFIVCHDSVIFPKHLPPEIQGTFAGALAEGHVDGGDGPSGADPKERIVEVLRRTDWNMAKSARILGIARNTLYQRMKTYGISRENNFK
ncbi:MAG: sigma 54-interacting transcriptional regulator [Candidatus Hydrogenedentes bacterium]|nr:sigma 54-interacting transcriptional regulator [Candidatus Hydrogenedentota bacterium]